MLLKVSEPPRPKHHPRLTFAPLAWLKLLFFCHAGPSEVGGFGVAAVDDLLHVEDFITVRQEATSLGVRFVDDAVADYFDRCVDAGLQPQRFSRVWCHTHPGDSPHPSLTDEDTFARCFGPCDWAVMFILSRTGRTYARLAFNVGPGGQMLVPTSVDWPSWPAHQPRLEAARLGRWQEEYRAHVRILPDPFVSLLLDQPGREADWWDSYAPSAELDEMPFPPVEELYPDAPID
jgi:hypothetical protein